jgi:hypothetical protein
MRSHHIGDSASLRGLEVLEVMLLDGLEGMPHVEVGHVTAENHAGDTGEVVVQSRPDTRVDNFLAEVVRHIEVSHGVHVPGRSGGVEPMNIKVDARGPQKGPEHLGHR